MNIKPLIICFICSLTMCLVGCGGEPELGSTMTLDDGTVLKGVPDWYANIPVNRDTLYSRGTSISVDMIQAQTAATNEAVKQIQENFGITRSEIERLPRGVLEELFMLVKDDGRVRAYVLLKIPFDELP